MNKDNIEFEVDNFNEPLLELVKKIIKQLNVD